MITDKTELEVRLKKILETPYTGKIEEGAMCYSPDYNDDIDYLCPTCEKITVQNTFDCDPSEIKKIREIIELLKKNKYDVILDESEYCKYCFKGIRTTDPSLIFKIRFNKNDNYHITRANYIDGYKTVLTFFENKDHFLGSYDDIRPLFENISKIYKMTGIGKDIVEEWKKNKGNLKKQARQNILKEFADSIKIELPQIEEN